MLASTASRVTPCYRLIHRKPGRTFRSGWQRYISKVDLKAPMNNPLLNNQELPEFSAIKPEHVEPAVHSVLDENRKALDALLSEQQANDGTSFTSAILPIEQMSDRLHRTWSPVSHLNSVANSSELREVYNNCLPLLARYHSEVAQDRRLYELYKQVADQVSEQSGGAETPESSLLQHALLEFHLGGIDLPADKQARYREIREEMAQLQARFEQNLLDSMTAWSYHIDDEGRLSGLPDNVIETAAQAAKAEQRDGWVFGLDQPTYVAMLTYADDATLRETFYEAWTTRASDTGPNGSKFDNTEPMERILELRHELAQVVGYKNYADYALATRMAGSVEEVTGFLRDLAVVSKPAAKKELAELEQFAGKPLQPWDVGYYSEKLRLERYSISDEELRPYFPLERVLAGLFELTENLYGITVVADDSVDIWNPDVRYFRIRSRDGEEVGSVYCDIYARKNKRAGAWMDECLVRKNIDAQLQLPVAHLVCNFAAPLNGNDALLTHDDIVTLFHEFGHTLHHLLTRIDYPSISGINGVPWDAVELPSQFMENFAWNPDVVRALSSHVETGEPLPDELLNKLEASRVFQAGMQMVRQLEFGLFDWYLHSEYGERPQNAPLDAMRRARDEVAVIQAPDYNRTAHGFAHIFSGGYAAGYYSYKWAEVLAADAFSAFQTNGPLDTATAERFRNDILEIGGSRNIAKAFEHFMGRPPAVDALLAQSGISN